MHRDDPAYSKDALDTLGDRTTYVTMSVLGLIAVVVSLELDDPALLAIGWICVALPLTFIAGLARHAWHQRQDARRARAKLSGDRAESGYAPPNTRRT